MATVLVLAGGDISQKLPFLQAGCACPALIPVNTRPLAAYVFDFYGDEHDIHLYVNSDFVDEVLRELPPAKHGFRLHALAPSHGVVGTLKQALHALDPCDEIIVNLVTTIPTALPKINEVQVARLPAHSAADWSAIFPAAEGLQFFAKGIERPPEALAFTGVFQLAPATLAEALHAASRENDLLSVIEAAAPLAGLHLQTVEWIDCGHETNYYKSRASLVNSRSFNALKVDTRRGTITKTSSDKTKLAREAAYIEMLPAALRVLFPRIVSRSGTHDEVDSYEMEYYGYPNLAEHLLYWNLSKDNWWRCFDALHDSLNLFQEHPASIGPDCFFDFFWNKTVSRIESYLRSLPEPTLRGRLESDSVRLNGKTLPPLISLLATAETFIGKAYRESSFGVFHGDFCFNNILFDLSSGVVRLIDPRGSFGPRCPGIHGDWRYDLAKLAHSSIGHYDYLVNGLFTVAGEAGGRFQLEIGLRANASWLEEMTAWLLHEQGAEPREIAVMTSLLFLSMGPLHADDSDRQLAFFLRGIDLLHHALL